MQNAPKKTTSMVKKFAIAATIMLFAATSSFAELAGMGENAAAKSEESSSGIKALFGISGGNSMITDDGTIFMNLRIGIDFLPLLSSGMWVSSIMSDVKNHNVKQLQMVNYKAFGGFVELFPLRISDFSLSVPIQVGGGAVSALEPDDEAYESEDYFFIADMAVHFNYRITKMLEVSIGGGYRMFAGIEANNLENLDFCTPFGELRFTVRE